jgi:site-specific DNA-methyltransferase (adenine-specific)
MPDNTSKIKLSEIKLNSDNPRLIKDDKFKKLVASIKDFPKMMELRPIIVDDTMTILGGNMRYNALREAGYTEIDDSWVKQAKDLTPEEKKQFIIKDNLPFGEWDWDILGNNFEIKDLLDWGFDEKDLKIEQDIEEDEAPEVSDEPAISKLGEVYQLGRHRLMCGDATNKDDAFLLMDFGKVKADMVFTDPPYGVNYEGKTKDKLKIQNDIETNTFADSLPNYISHTKAGAAFYVCCPPGNNFKDFFLPFEEYCYLSSTIIWAKNSLVMGHGDYHYQHEPILYGWNKDGAHQYYGDRKQTTLWNIDRPTSSKEHPTMKPIALITKAINNSSKQDDIVLDLFGGSGSTLIACEQTNRTCYMMEIDPKYCDVIRKRYAKFIGKEEEGQTL